MKSLIALLLVLIMWDSFAEEIKVTKMNRSNGFHSRFDLKSNLSEKLVLDCQSFLQGLMFGEKPQTQDMILLADWECEQLMTDMKKSTSSFSKHCLEVDYQTMSLISHSSCGR